MSMTREDVLRELELLPVWKLREPAKQDLPMQASPVLNMQAVETPTATAPINRYACTVSEDKQWAFIWPADLNLSLDANTLFANILVALKITKTSQKEIENMASAEAKIVVMMGESAAQQALNTSAPIETLRGKAHPFASTNLVATYHPNDMLQDLKLKAKTWEDLCLAKRILDA